MNSPALGATRRDLAVAVARGAIGAIPLLGNLVAEVVDHFIPGQKLDRVVEFIRLLETRVIDAQDGLALLQARFNEAEGSDLLEQAIVQASRAVTEDRRRQIANLLFKGVTEEDLRYDRVQKLLRILESLTDSELILLVYHSRMNWIGSPWHAEMTNKYPELLRPVSREIGRPQAEVERGALRESYETTLIGLHLLEFKDGHMNITSLGEMLLRYIADPERNSNVESEHRV